MRQEVIDDLVARYIPEKAYAEQWDTAGLHEEVLRIFGLDLPIADWAKEEGIADEAIRERMTDAVERKMAEKAAQLSAPRSCGSPRRRCCCRCSTRAGRSICWRSTICATASACAPTASAIR